MINVSYIELLYAHDYSFCLYTVKKICQVNCVMVGNTVTDIRKEHRMQYNNTNYSLSIYL